MQKEEYNFNLEMEPCPVETTLKLISNKWKVLILRELLTGTKRFNELRNGIDGISQKVLTQNLRSMEEDKIVSRTVYPEVPPRVDYSLNELGNSLKPIIAAMEVWGMDYMNKQD